MNKRILLSLGTLVVAGAVIAGGTGAFFSDTETSADNVFTAGSVTLELTDIIHTYSGDDTDNPTQFSTNPAGFNFAFADLKPLDSGNIEFDLQNGANEAFVCARVNAGNDEDVTLVDSEVALSDDLSDGELDDFLSFSFNGNVGTISDVDGQWTLLGTAAANGPTGSSVDYCFGDIVGGTCMASANDTNIAQTDSLSADVEFYAVQTRNNADFSCSDLNEEEGPDYVYETDFETADGNSSWISFNGTTTIVSSGTDGVTSAEGGFHALADGDVFSRLGGYSDVFPIGGYTTEVDVYLDMAEADGSDKRFDFSVASNGSDNNHQRDFIFHLGTNPGIAGQWGASVSNNAPGWPLNPGASPVDITATGWYTLQAYFYDNAGVLAVDMKVLDAGGNTIGSWTRSSPLDTIPAEVGGNRYAWLLNNPFTDLPIDNAKLYLGAPTI